MIQFLSEIKQTRLDAYLKARLHVECACKVKEGLGFTTICCLFPYQNTLCYSHGTDHSLSGLKACNDFVTFAKVKNYFMFLTVSAQNQISIIRFKHVIQVFFLSLKEIL